MKCGKPVSRPANRAGRNFNEGVIDVMLESILWSLGIAVFLGVVVGMAVVERIVLRYNSRNFHADLQMFSLKCHILIE